MCCKTGGVLKIMLCCRTWGGRSVSENPRPQPSRSRCHATSLELGRIARVQGARGGGARGAQLYTIGQRGSQGPQNTRFKKFSATTGTRVGFPWDRALILPINVGDQGDQGSRGMHTLVVFGGISTVRIATKTFWTVVARGKVVCACVRLPTADCNEPYSAVPGASRKVHPNRFVSHPRVATGCSSWSLTVARRSVVRRTSHRSAAAATAAATNDTKNGACAIGSNTER